MNGLEHLVAELVDAVPDGAGGAFEGVRVVVDAAEIALPIEARLGAGGAVVASAPRGRQRTGFDPPLARLRLSLTREAP